ncbi:agmatine deiminase family protein [Chitinophaga varians]|uniref:Agmatine deiminase family protein n=1 Tax=Chitinophaga varians TaxID=2202339 RepID=A0A847S2E9_9BACT|nr:agmatine deiminase family protein [Chitinophaga varians]NLR67605.1 agmatine deiminase family protein [Chitinophaga varians]
MTTTLMVLSALVMSCAKEDAGTPAAPADTTAVLYKMPEEAAPHEGTWLQWPHEYQYGRAYRNRLDATWIAMTQALVPGEKVHLVVYDQDERERVADLLQTAQVPMANVDFTISRTDDVWVRDNGPIFVKDGNGRLLMEDWGFNGWGNKAAYENCDRIPGVIAANSGMQRIDLNTVMINEGGSVEMDGNGVLMACKSSVLNKNRNPGMTQEQAEALFTKYLGVTRFIWLEGKAGLDITDMHIDGFARFADSNTIITMSADDLDYWQVPQQDVRTLYSAVNRKGTAYKFVKVPLTQNNVVTTYGKNVGKGSYINFYIANNAVLVPNYNDPNDAVANSIIQSLYPGRKVIGIDCRNLFANGGMVHCVTQQQPR